MLEFFAAVFLMLAAARLFGEFARRGKLPSLVGELLAGMVLGVSVLNVIQPTGVLGTDLTIVTNLSLFFIMLLTGLNLDSEDIIEVGWKAVLLSLPGFILPFTLGAFVAYYFGLGLTASLTVGLTLAITAVPVNAIILMDIGILKTKLGTTVLTAGVIDDQISLIVLGVLLQLPAGASTFSVNMGTLGLSVGRTLLFVGVVFFIDRMLRKNPQWIRPRLPKIKEGLLARESGIALLVIFGLGVALFAEALNLHFIIGAYFAGILLNRAIGEDYLKRSLDVFSGLTFGIFAPLLFAFIGIQLNLQALAAVAPLFLTLLVVAIAGKLGGGYFGARIGGFSPAESRVLGALLNSRGMVELVIASIVFQAGLINVVVFSIVVAVGVIATTMSAILARLAVANLPASNPQATN